MPLMRLTKPIKTVVRSFQIGADGKKVLDAQGNEIVANTREVLIDNVDVPQYTSLAEITQVAGSEDKVVEYFNDKVKSDAMAPVRIVGARFTLEDSDSDIAAKGRELASLFNPFADRRKSESTKARAEKFDNIQKLIGSVDDAELIRMIKEGKI